MNEQGNKHFDFQHWAKNRVKSEASNMNRGRECGYIPPLISCGGTTPRGPSNFPPASHTGPSNSHNKNVNYLDQLNGTNVPYMPGYQSINEKMQQFKQDQEIFERSPEPWQRNYQNYDNAERMESKQENNNGSWYNEGQDGYGNSQQQYEQNFNHSNYPNYGGYNNQGMMDTNHSGENSFPTYCPDQSYGGSTNQWQGTGIPHGSYAGGPNDHNFQTQNRQNEEYNNNDDLDYIHDLQQYVRDRRYEDDPQQAEYSRPRSHNDGNTRMSTNRASVSRPPSNDGRDNRRPRSRIPRSSCDDGDSRRSKSRASTSRPSSRDDRDTRRSKSRVSRSRRSSRDDRDIKRSRSRASRSRQSSRDDKDARTSRSRASRSRSKNRDSRSRRSSHDGKDARRSRSRVSRTRPPSYDNGATRKSESRATRSRPPSDGGTNRSGRDCKDVRRSKSIGTRSRRSSHDGKDIEKSSSRVSRRSSHDDNDARRSKNVASRSKASNQENEDVNGPTNRDSMWDVKEQAPEKDSTTDKSLVCHNAIETENHAVKRSPPPDTDRSTQSSPVRKTSLNSYPSASAITESIDSPVIQSLQTPAVDISIAIESLAATTIINEHKFKPNDTVPSLTGNSATNVEVIDLTSTAIIKNRPKTEIMSPPLDIEVVFESEKQIIGNDTCINLPDVEMIKSPVLPDQMIGLSGTEANIENIPKTRSKPPVSHKNLIDISEIETVVKNELTMKNESINDYSPASPDIENKGLAVTRNEIESESSEDSSSVSANSASINLQTSLENKNNGPSYITTTSISLSDLLSKRLCTDRADSNSEKSASSAANMSVSEKQNTASTPTCDIVAPEGENQKQNRKRSIVKTSAPASNIAALEEENEKLKRKRTIDRIVATKTNDHHSSTATNREKHSGPEEEPLKKLTNQPTVSVNKQPKKPVIVIKRIENVYVPTTSLHMDKNLVNQNQASERTAMMSEPSLPTAANLNQEKNQSNEEIVASVISSTSKAVNNKAIEFMNVKKKRKSDSSEAKISKKAKVSLKINDSHARKDNKQNIFTKNRIKQFKIILKIMQSRSNGWSLSQLDELNENNFCDAIHHFERIDVGICCFTEVKFFDNSVKANKITYKNLFGDEFNILRYFGTFLKFEHPCFHHEYSKMIIYMNREIDESLLKNNGINVSYSNGSYSFDMGKSYEESKIYKKCLEFFELSKLAELLRDLVRSQKVFHFNMELMRKYHLALINDRVLNVIKEKQNGKDICVAKFHPDFIDYEETLSKAAKELHEHLEKHNCSPANNMKFRLGNKDFGKNVASARFEETVDNLPSENCKDTFEHFFKVFQIVKIDEKEMERVVDNELDEEFSKLEEESYINAAKEELLMSLKSKGLNPDVLEPIMQRISKLKLMKNISAQIIPQLEIEFEQKTYSSLEQAMRQKRIILCLTENLSLSDVKMRLFLKNNGLVEKQAGLIITDDILFRMADDVVRAFSHRSTSLLTILWKNHALMDTTQIVDVIKRLENVLSMNLSSKNIIIIVEKNNINQLLSRLRFTKIDDDLTMKLRNNVSESTIVYLQERKFNLIDLADDAAISNLLRSTEIRKKLLTNQMEIGRELFKPTGHEEKSFDFRLKQQVNIDSKIFQENINDIFVIHNISCAKFYREYKPSGRIAHISNSKLNSIAPLKTRFIILESDVDPADIMKRIKADNVHVLSYYLDNFIWKSTVGSSLALLKHRISNENAVYTTSNIGEILITGPKTVLITGESGIGKSVCLYDFAKQARKLFQTNPVWLVQVDLNELLENITESIETSDGAIYFLADYLGLLDEQKKLFTMSAQGRLKLKLILFIDGYDEVPDKNLINNLLQNLKFTCIQKIFVASRTNELESILGTFSYSIQFEDEEKVQFMTKLFDGKDSEIDMISKNKFLNTPLHLTMFTELYQKYPERSAVDSYFDLYKDYVNLHLPSDNQLKNAYKLSAQKLLTNDELQEFNATIDNIEFELPEKLLRPTIIEYFAAMWLSKKSDLSNKKCMDYLVERTSSVFLSVYLTAYNLENKNSISLNKYAENGSLNFVKATTKLGVLKKPSLKRIILNNKKNSYEMLSFLLKYYNDTGCHEFIQRDKYPKSTLVKYINKTVDGQTPLEAAAQAERLDVACGLIFRGADISVLREKHSTFIENMASYAITDLTGGNSNLGPVVTELLKISPHAAFQLDNSTQFPKVLSYLFSNGHDRLIEELLNGRSINDRIQLLEALVDGKSMLDHVNDSQLIKDDERRSMISYIVTNSRANLLQNNIDSILRSACLSGHENTFKYFISSNTKEMSIPILQKALRSNDERVIEFLMRDTKRTIDSDGNNALHQAINLEVSRKTINYLLGKVGINDRNNHGETALHLAFKRAANLSKIEFLLSAGASLDATDNLGIPPWVYVLQYRYATTHKESSRYSIAQQRELMTYLLQKHHVKFPTGKGGNYDFDLTKKEILPKLNYFANLNDYNLNYNDIGVSRLHDALLNRDEKDWCVFLINQGADVNIEKDGKSALHVALKYGCYEVAELMLQNGAVVNKMDVNKNTPLDYLTSKSNDSSCHRRMKEILYLAKKIFNGAENLQDAISVDSSNIDTSHFYYLLNCRDMKKRTLLHVAALTGKAMIIEKLHQLSIWWKILHTDFVPIDVNATDEDGNTPLHLAASVNIQSVEKLLSIGARFQVKNSMGKTPMDLACTGSSIRKLLQATADLFKCVGDGKFADVKAILKKFPATQNARDNTGKTPLYLAKDEKTMIFLLTDVNVLDEDQRSPIYYAAVENKLERVKLLLKAGAIYDFESLRDGKNESFEFLRIIDEIFEDIHSHEPKLFVNENPWALDERLNGISDKFGISRDVIVNIKDRQKNSLLHYAAKYDYVNVAENLLKNGAIFNCRNAQRKIPSNFAVSSERLFKSVENLFVKLNVNAWNDVDPDVVVNCRTSGGYTLLHKAVEKGCYEAVEWLIDHGADVGATANNSVEMRFDENKYPRIAELLSKNR